MSILRVVNKQVSTFNYTNRVTGHQMQDIKMCIIWGK